MKDILKRPLTDAMAAIMIGVCLIVLIAILYMLLSESTLTSEQIFQWLERPVSEVKVWQLLVAIYVVCSLAITSSK